MTVQKIDSTNLNILTELYANSRITNKELSAKVKIAPSTCLERVKKLTSSGVIKAFSLEINYNSIGGNIEAMTSVRLGKHSAKVIESFRNALIACPEVLSVYYMGGGNDFLLHITVKDTEHLRDFIIKSITSRDEVVHLETALIYEHLTSHQLPFFE